MKNFLKSIARTPRQILTILIPLALFFAGWWFGLPSQEKSADSESSVSETIWTCSMHPQIRQPKLGLCPICAMDLIPLESGSESTALRQVSISPEASALLDIRVSPVLALDENSSREISVFGRIAHDERLTSAITSRIPGRIEKLFIDFTGTQVEKGDPLAELYSPEIYLTQKELMEARDTMRSSSPTVRDTYRKIYEAAIRKLELLEISPEEIARIQTAKAPSDRITIRSPQVGRVLEKMALEGSYVKTGDRLFTISDHSVVWLNLEVYENDLPLMSEGLEVVFSVDSLPGESFSGTIAYIDHRIDPLRRVAQVRVDVPNPEDKIKPGMFANARVISPAIPPEREETQRLVTVPESALLRTGERAVVYVRLPGADPVFEGREVLLGPDLGSRHIVESGLSAGELVVTNGAFMLDSELQIKARPSMMNPNAGLEEPAHNAPKELSGQWKPVLRALGRMETGDVAAEIETMRMVIEKVSAEPLPPNFENLWREFSNRLLVDLASAKDKDPAIARSIVRHSIEQTARYLGLSSYAIAPLEADPEAAARLEKMIRLYLPIAKALASDDPATAATAAAKLAQSAELPVVQKPAETIASSKQLKPQRVAFETLSDTLIAEVRANGLDRIGNAYLIHCPMASDSKGADWLSSVPEVLNPYYGDSMLNCGSVTETLSLEK